MRRYVEVANAVRAADSPWVHPMTFHEATGLLRHHWDGEPPVPFLAAIDTWNAASNRFMIGVNEALSYRVLGEALVFHRTHERRYADARRSSPSHPPTAPRRRTPRSR